MVPAKNSQAALAALLAFAIFSFHDVIVKWLGEAYHPVQIIFFSVLFGFPALLLMQLRDKSSENLLPKHPYWTGMRMCAVTITGVCAFYAFTHLPLAQTYAILFSTPLLITLLAIPLLGERVGWKRLAAVGVGLLGVMVVLRPGSVALGPAHLAALIAAVMNACNSIIMRKIGEEERPIVMLIYPMFGNLCVMGAVLPSVYQPMSIEGLGLVVVMSVLAVAAMRLMVLAYTKGEAGIVAPMQYSQILWAALWGSVFFGEWPDLATGLGAAIIVASGVFIVLRENTANVSDQRPVTRTKTRLDVGTSPRISAIQRSTQARDDAQD